MRIDEHIECLSREGELLAATAELAGTSAEVPTCPGWRVRDLVRHTGMVHRWATGFVTQGYREYRPDEGEPDLDGAELLAWFREGHAALVGALREAPADLECWTFLPAPSPLAFWARRQTHETTVHRMDASSAAGQHVVDAQRDLALDGIDELLTAFHARGRSRVRTEKPGTLRVRPTDGPPEAVWTVHLSPDGPPRTVRDDEGPADAELSGTAGALYAVLWNRAPVESATLTGDARLADVWRELSAITWN
ncbi:maleylpyruvate isomerase family mycothiol-dependent enzyme [Streptomyces sp. NBC_00237]|uniref:maleylpyruvate isomerase family mycothiol-dependent enzyme n=1 Tax=Streptomyces sp. NBC_00237 TaxID=2975687 RepID=UPI00225B42A2|nr:maleylpyruvate isomerase family mycothiol-dependent enzyme [Streptomyces sp. NBC_00237]MCX5207095.1 maleylpyruvate isomerase family mycothiol-dependent enzyme [Streptomyces sp. NBC_00237]